MTVTSPPIMVTTTNGHHLSSSSRSALATGKNNGNAVKRKRGRAVTVAGISISARMTAVYDQYMRFILYLRAMYKAINMAPTLAAVSTDVGELTG